MEKTGFKKFIKIVVLLLLACYLIYQLYASVYNPLTTETATHYNGSDGFRIDGLIVRSEALVKSNSDMVQYYVIDDGEKVSKGGVISELYSDSSQTNISNQIRETEKKINNIEVTMAYNSTEAVDLALLSSKVYGSLSEYVTELSTGDFENAEGYSSNLLSDLSIRQAATGEAADFSAALAALNGELAQLRNQKEPSKGSITAENSGYFVSKTDGYESVLNTDDVLDITPDKLEKITPQPVSKDTVGKIVGDYKWYIVSLVGIDQSARFSVGKEVKLQTSIHEMSEFSAKIAAINKGREGNKAVLVLECENMNEYISAIRNITVTVVTEEFSGLMVRKKALRVVGDKLGVYVVSGMQARFVDVEVQKYSGEYAICKSQSTNSKVLRLYDEVIVDGKNLYDGKMVN